VQPERRESKSSVSRSEFVEKYINQQPSPLGREGKQEV